MLHKRTRQLPLRFKKCKQQSLETLACAVTAQPNETKHKMCICTELYCPPHPSTTPDICSCFWFQTRSRKFEPHIMWVISIWAAGVLPGQSPEVKSDPWTTEKTETSRKPFSCSSCKFTDTHFFQ